MKYHTPKRLRAFVLSAMAFLLILSNVSAAGWTGNLSTVPKAQVTLGKGPSCTTTRTCPQKSSACLQGQQLLKCLRTVASTKPTCKTPSASNCPLASLQPLKQASCPLKGQIKPPIERATPTPAPVRTPIIVSTPKWTPAATPKPTPKVTPKPIPQGTPATDSSYNTAMEASILTLVNVERQKAGLKPLVLDSQLTQVARLKSRDMHDAGYFSHTSPTYGSPFDMMSHFGITYRAAGENIAVGQKDGDAVMQAWMNSPGHRANILNPNYTHIGIGAFVSADGYHTYFTQEFTG